MSFLPLSTKTRNLKRCISSLECNVTLTSNLCLTEGFHCRHGSVDWAKLKSMPIYKTPVFRGQKSGRRAISPISHMLKARHSAANVRSARLPTAEVDKFTKQPTYNIHKSINNKGTWQQYKHTEGELPRSCCQDSTSAESRDWVLKQLTVETLSLGITYTIRPYIKQSYTGTRRNYRHRRQIMGWWEGGGGGSNERKNKKTSRRWYLSSGVGSWQWSSEHQRAERELVIWLCGWPFA